MMVEEAKKAPQALEAGNTEFKELEIELTDEDREELSKIDWSSIDSVDETEEENTDTGPVAEEEPEPEPKEVEYELPGGAKVTAEQLSEMMTYDKRYKDLQADYTRKAQENSELQQRLMAMQQMHDYQAPQFRPQPFQPAEMEIPYATDAEKVLAEKVKQLELAQAQRDYQEWQKTQREVQARADEIVSSFRTKHPDIDDVRLSEVIAEANRNGTTNLELVYRSMLNFDGEIEKMRKEERAKIVEELRKKRSARLEPSSQPGKVPEQIDYNKLTDEQRHALMVKDLIEGG